MFECSVKMKAVVVISLQVILLLLLPGMDGTVYRLGDMVKKSYGSEDYIGNGRNHTLRTLKTVGVCYGPSSDMEIRVQTTGKEKIQAKIRHSKTCYKDVRVMMTPECNALQSVDFSDLRISDFCIGEWVTFSGSIYFYVGMSRPSVLEMSISQSPDSRRGSRSLPFKYSTSDERVTCLMDACNVLGLMMCPVHHRLGCDCPIKRENILLDSDIFIGEDFIPDDFGTGPMHAYIILHTPQDEVCLNIAFERVTQLNIE